MLHVRRDWCSLLLRVCSALVVGVVVETASEELPHALRLLELTR